MTHPDEALRLVLEAVSPLAAVVVPLGAAHGLVLAEAFYAPDDLPRFDDSAMDGWALRAGDARAAGARLPAGAAVMAGDVPAPIAPGGAVRVRTGARLPQGADCVVPKELAREEGGAVVFPDPPEPGQHVRRRGSDSRRGERLVEAGRAVGSFETGVFASHGVRDIRVIPRPRVGVVTSGDELRRPGRPLGPSGRWDSSSPALCAALRGWGCVPVPVGAAADDKDDLALHLRTALSRCDAVFVTGGVSVGDRDLTRPVLASLGAREVFWRTAVKPGKPLLFASAGGKPVWGLPGNPVSSLVTAEVFARPALERMAGLPERKAFPEAGLLAAGFEKPAALRQFLFCAAAGSGRPVSLTPLLPQHSGRLSMGVRARALAVLPEGRESFAAGTEVAFRWL
ncbi:MAG: molybdopterin molybdotransferase MoeA [Elusimicrobia bacterium]|nr:molybdopterin molybdotransferase MoeA [Elusimicrobiota bacterium]